MCTVLAMDFDGTLSHSIRRYKPGDVCIEQIGGAAHGYMSPFVIESLHAARKAGCEIAIVTSRSASQYERIDWPRGIKPSLAFVDNGAYLIQDAQNSRKSVLYNSANDMASLSSALASVGNVRGVKRCRLVDSCYIVAIVDQMDNLAELEAIAAKVGLVHVRGGRKSYFFPPLLNKGMACRQLRSMGFTNIVAAGDSTNDLALLESADVALVPESVYKAESCSFQAQLCVSGLSFEEFVADRINELVAAMSMGEGRQ